MTPVPDAGRDAPVEIEAAPACPDCQLKAQVHNRQEGDDSEQVSFVVKIGNTGTQPVSLRTVTFRYWFTNDGAADEVACDFAVVGCASLSMKFVAVTPAKTKADTYLEVGFEVNTNLQPGRDTDEIQIRVHDPKFHVRHTQTNDYSYVATGTKFVDAPKITAYVGGKLAWGTEPP